MSDFKENPQGIGTIVTKSVFKNQPLQLSALETGIDLTSVTSVALKYVNPAKTSGTFSNAASVDSPATAGKVTVQIDASELSQVGRWRIWAEATFTSDVYPGEPIVLPVYEIGEIDLV